MTLSLTRSSSPRPRDAIRLCSYDSERLAAYLRTKGVAEHAARIAASKAMKLALESDGASFDALSLAGIGAVARAALLELDTTVSLRIADRVVASDGTIRLALATEDGGLVESVLIPGPKRTTLCVSSQVGCARACTFCETGRLGLSRQLAAHEIVDQVRVARSEWRGRLPPLQNLVFMGMGEPFDNLGEVARAVSLLTDSRAFAFAPSRVTVSTVGVADKIERFYATVRAELAVSLNAPDDARRGAIMPVNTRFPMAALRAELLRAVPPKRKVFFEYVVFDRFNDDPADADLLAEYVAGIRCRVNVIPANPGPDPSLRAPSPERVDAFVARLSSWGVTTLVRTPRGRDVGGACGQLAGAARAEVRTSG